MIVPRTITSAAVVATLVAIASNASAQDDRVDTLGPLRHQRYESPQNFAIELRFSSFKPQVDSDPNLNGCTPFSDIFGSGSSLLAGVEFDWQALRIPHVGTLGPGAGIGYVSFSANAPYSATASSSGKCVTSTGQASGENTSLNIYPMYLVGVFRADGLWKDLRVPVIPYAKLGGAFALWQATNTLGTSVFNSTKGQGYSLGTELALGIAFNLNFLDPNSAREFDESMGVNSTLAFAEWTDANINGLGLQSDPLRVGGTSWTFGIAWEF
ncbi:MAG TPA: MXAN_2562 family outer membrane beta-barrel protein [Polyangiaceae bacterium]